MSSKSDEMEHGRRVLLDERAAGRRVDEYLAKRFPNWSRSVIRRFIADGQVTSEHRPLKPSSILRAGEHLRITAPGIGPDGPPPALPEILHEDARVMVLDKPPHLICHPAGQRFTWSLVWVMRTELTGQGPRTGDWPRVERVDLVHRLDRETSGVIVATKDLDANRYLKGRIKAGAIEKEYLAIVRGVVPWSEKEVREPIGPALSGAVRIRQGIRPDGLWAHTSVCVVQRLAEHTLVRCKLHTGRNHQIRVHLAHLGFPLLGDKLYGQPDWVFLRNYESGIDAELRAQVRFWRHALHAHRVRLPHPDGGHVEIHSPLPADLRAIVEGAEPSWTAS